MEPIQVGSRLKYKITKSTVLLLNISCVETDHQQILQESLRITPDIQAVPCQVGKAKNRFHRLVIDPCDLLIEYDATVRLTPATETPPKIEQLDYAVIPADVLDYLNQSRYCESDKLATYANSHFGGMPANFDRVNAICDWTYENLQYVSGTTDLYTTACDVLIQRTGVCRDFAHVAIAFCRALGVPARYVSGYACRLVPPDFHGFFEAYLEDRWYLFDPTRLAPPAGLVRIGVGRDAADTAFATIWGEAQLEEMEVWANETNTNEALLDKDEGSLGVSTA
jgi:transglutaminase-like putative cysteine protease